MGDSNEQGVPQMLMRPSLDERGRQTFAKHLRQFVFGPLRAAARRAYEARVAPLLQQQSSEGQAPRVRARAALLHEPEYRFFADLHRISQEQIWSSTAETVERHALALRDQWRALEKPRGSLRLDPAMTVPEYLRRMDTHCMPGSYYGEWLEDDLANGALYQRGSFLYAPSGGPDIDGAGRSSLALLRRELPDFVPRRIVDFGCGTCGPLWPYFEAFPRAEIHGVDVGAPLLRFAHLAAERRGLALHLRQADAAHTGYEPGSFDLVTAHIMFHETESEAVPAILAEAHRILRDDGVLLIVDLPDARHIPDVFQQVIFDGDAYYNNEHFWQRMHELDWQAELARAGFPAGAISLTRAPMLSYEPPGDAGSAPRWIAGRFNYFAVIARKAAASPANGHGS